MNAPAMLFGRTIAVLLTLTACGLAGKRATAAERPALCKLVVEGKTYIDGKCDFEADPDGSFRIFGSTYFAYVDVTGNTAEATWNADPKATHAHTRLGTLTRNGACWESATAQICAREQPAKK